MFSSLRKVPFEFTFVRGPGGRIVSMDVRRVCRAPAARSQVPRARHDVRVPAWPALLAHAHRAISVQLYTRARFASPPGLSVAGPRLMRDGSGGESERADVHDRRDEGV